MDAAAATFHEAVHQDVPLCPFDVLRCKLPDARVLGCVIHFWNGREDAFPENLADLRAERPDGVTYDPAISEATLRAIKVFATREPTIILPAHDPDEPTRLADRQTYA